MSTPASVRLSVVIPAHNEAVRLPPTLEALFGFLSARKYRTEILVVDDGSSDGTAALVRESARDAPVPLQLVQHPDLENHGKGAAVRLGMLAARGAYRLFMDADNSISIDHAEIFWPVFEQGADVVIGCRTAESDSGGEGEPRFRRVARTVGNRLIQIVAVSGFTHTQTGFKMFTAEAAERVFSRLTINRWGFDVEALVIAREQGLTVREVPVTIRNRPESKVRLIAYLQTLGEIWRIRRNLRGGHYSS